MTTPSWVSKITADQLKYLGEVELGQEVAIGDPSLLRQGASKELPSSKDYAILPVAKGTWHLFLSQNKKSEAEELVAVHENAGDKFFELYEGAQEIARVANKSGLLAMIDKEFGQDESHLDDMTPHKITGARAYCLEAEGDTSSPVMSGSDGGKTSLLSILF